ncbi:MAG: hypothetical protein M3Z92_16335 [Bacteroidota bacterium]|nr:hypothetical protein [Bacteroidota bacterium]
MLLANKMMKPKYKLTCFFLAALPLFCFAQENSPYSRYGIGNLVPSGNILNRGMGGISAGFTDPVTINNNNPATYSNLVYTTLDVGIEYDGRVIKSQNPLGSFKSNNGIISYLQVGFPLLSGNKKAEAKQTAWGLAFGLKPISKINYKINALTRNSIDSVASVYEGSGGISEAYIGSALKIKNFSIGFNTGYLFGEKNYDTKLIFIDSITNYYYKADYNVKTRFGGAFFNAGVQYAVKVKGGYLRFGAYGNLQQQFNASKDNSVQTFNYNANTGSADKIDSVYENTGQKGKVQLPSSIGAGFTLEKEHVLLGADIETTQWDNYRFFGQKDLVKNSWLGKFGIQYFPSPAGSPKYFSNVRYRAGISFGKDYISADKNLPVYTVSLGGTFPLKLRHSFYDYQYSFMSLSLEYGNRGNNSNNIKENTFRVGVGFSLSDRNWFVRRKFN